MKNDELLKNNNMHQEFHINNVQEWGKSLISKYPLVFLEDDQEVIAWSKNLSPEERVNLRYGFEFGKGWLSLVEELASAATEIVLEDRINNPDSYIHSCIWKQKFGTMRFQGNEKLSENALHKFYALLNQIESKSGEICESCGREGSRSEDRRYISVKCNNCRNPV